MREIGIVSLRRLSGVSMSGYSGGCERCRLGAGEPVSYLPTTIKTLELHFHGWLCHKCEGILSNSKDERLAFIKQKDKEKIERDKARAELD